MSAKHKRPFFVFAAVAAICCMVLVTGVRSKADGGGSPEHVVAPPVATAGPPISLAPEASVGSAPASGSGPETGADPGRGASDSSRPTDASPHSFEEPQSDTGPTGLGGSDPDSGPTDVPLPDLPDSVDVDPGTDDELGLPDDDAAKPDKSTKERKHRGKHGGKNDDENDDEDTALYGHPTQPESLDEDPDDQVENADETEVADETEIEFDVEDEDQDEPADQD